MSAEKVQELGVQLEKDIKEIIIAFLKLNAPNDHEDISYLVRAVIGALAWNIKSFFEYSSPNDDGYNKNIDRLCKLLKQKL